MLNSLRAWLDDTRPKVLPSSPLGKAMRYLHNQWNALTRFCDDARYGIDTNPVENAIRPFCLGRRNWLFSDTVPDANASARLYSLIETAKACPRESGGQRTRTLRLPAPRVHRTAQGPITPRRRSPAADPARPRRPCSTLTPRHLLQRTSIAPFPGRLPHKRSLTGNQMKRMMQGEVET